MKNNKEQLEVFGFGLGILIPYIIMVHILKPMMSFGLFVLGFCWVLFVVSKVSRNKILYFITLGAIIFLTIYYGKPKIEKNVILFWVLSVILIGISFIKVEFLEPIYIVWMKIAHGIGTVFSIVVLSVIFYLIFAPIGLFFRLIKKDFLDRDLDQKAATYWKKRDYVFNKERCHKQF